MYLTRYAAASDHIVLCGLDTHISSERLLRSINDHKVLVICRGDVIVGFLRYGFFWDSIPFVNLLFLIKEYRGQGLGTQLMTDWEKRMKDRGFTNVMTSTQSNECAQFFYRKLGYEDIGGFTPPGETFELIFSKTL